MRTKKFYCAAAFCACVLAGGNVSMAQDVFVDDATGVSVNCNPKVEYYSNWRNNWFIEVSAGGNQAFVERGQAAPEYALGKFDKKKWTATYSLGFGRWVNPYIGLRLKGVYGSIHWDAPLTPAQAEAGLGWSSMKHASVSIEALWDMFNSLGGVNPNRVFSIVPFFGIGGDASWGFKDRNGNQPVASNVYKDSGDFKSVDWTIPAMAGLQFRFRLCKYVDFFAEARATVYGDNWNNYVTGKAYDVLFSCMGGFNFNINGANGGGRSWKEFNECEYINQIAALNDQVNDLRGQLVSCGQTVAALQAQLPCPKVVEKECKNAPLMATVRFLINSYKILPTEEVSIYTMAEWLKANPNEKIVIAGYADKDTGTAEYNMELSEKRANAVKDALVNEYGIDPSRLTVKSFGSDVQEYPSHNDWNRIVIFKQ